MNSTTNTTPFWKQLTTTSSLATDTPNNRRTSSGHHQRVTGQLSSPPIGIGAAISTSPTGPKFPGRAIMKSNAYSGAPSAIKTGSAGDSHVNKTAAKQRTNSLSAMNTTPTKTSGGAVRIGSGGPGGAGAPAYHHHRRNNSSSFEVFTASCDDAWDSNIDDCLQTNHLNSNHQLSSSVTTDTHLSTHISSLLIRETPSTSKPLKQVSSTTTALRNDDKNNSKSTTTTTTTTTSANESSAKNNTNPVNDITQTDPKLAKITKIVYEDDVTDLNQLRSLAWAGIPNQVRPVTWKLLLGYLPIVRSKRTLIMDRKRAEYKDLVTRYYYNRPENDDCWRQIHIDIPRMQPLISIFQQPLVQGIFERILYVWSIRHPASGYVQGMNDLVTPFFVTYLSEFIPDNALSSVESFDVSTLTADTLAGVEADSFWSFTKLLDSIQDNYTFAQPGIQRLVNLLSCVVSRVDRNLHEHLEKHSVQYLQFAFRWMNNLLIREIPLRCIVRLWDTYLAEGAVATTATTNISAHNTSINNPSNKDGAGEVDLTSWSMGSGTPFSSAFHLFVCAAFLRFWSKNLLQEKDFQGLMLLLQNLPTFHWTDNEVRLLVADAYQLKYTFTPNHLKV